MRLFFCGDVMIGRGIDQILPHPGDPVLYESYVRSARDYVALAEQVSGPISCPVTFDYIWGDAVAEIDRRSPDLRIINLETSVTADGRPDAKGIHYRIHPDNIGCITAAKIDCCVLANNHVADWGMGGLADTVIYLAEAGIASVGAGSDAQAAGQPAILYSKQGRRVLVFAFACLSSGVPVHWAAGAGRPGVNLLPDLGEDTVKRVIDRIGKWRRAGDFVVVSIHWGPNWGYEIPESHRRFAHRLVEEAETDLIHGHSSHHPIGIEIYRSRPIFYGCGDFINDYEGIHGHEAFRPDLVLAYFADHDDESRGLNFLEMVPFQARRLRLNRATHADASWLAEVLDRESRPGHCIEVAEGGVLRLRWTA
ncbi:CapA family protein [Chelativorans xinjiangense]|uniref:CapA family protein n=1 Tax=Chelativorans xinjiangense TaxID=2681485 RepID=UPI001FE3461B|nr:CapA family protein [Chelativorans xinjiangense]